MARPLDGNGVQAYVCVVVVADQQGGALREHPSVHLGVTLHKAQPLQQLAVLSHE